MNPRILLAIGLSWAVSASPTLPPDIDEERFRELSSELRCLVCQNQSLADSSSALAGDLRQQVVQQMQAGKSDDDIRRFMVDRYGEFILYKPAFNRHNLLLWLGPFALLLIAMIVGWRVLRRRASGDPHVVHASLIDAEGLWQEHGRHQSPDPTNASRSSSSHP